MSTLPTHTEVSDRFALIAQEFCSAVESAPNLGKVQMLNRVYRILPRLIGEATSLPDVELNGDENPSNDNERQARRSHEEWQQLYNYLKQKLGDLNLYWQVFDPTKDNEAILGSLADDIADIYFDLKEGFGLRQKHQTLPEKSIWCWRFGFYSHWGKHAMDALRTIHSILEDANLGTE